ncbi:MAG: hypothetical protein JXA79_09385 [Deltaproteobacteria bacterium]|nr:hypothetical protein [Deltaproteobacteria bacterium]
MEICRKTDKSWWLCSQCNDEIIQYDITALANLQNNLWGKAYKQKEAKGKEVNTDEYSAWI